MRWTRPGGDGAGAGGYTNGVDEDEVSDAQAAEDEAWLAALAPGRRALVEMMLERLCQAENDSTYRPDRA